MTKYSRLRLLCAMLASTVAVGLAFILGGNRTAPASPMAFRDNTAQVAAAKTDRLVAEILKRPLFTAGRQPPQPPKIAKAEPPKLQGRLAGVMLAPDVRVALFARPGGKPISVKEGEVIDGWTTSKIEADQVVLTSAFGEKIVKLTNGTADEVITGGAHKAAQKKNQPVPAARPQPPAQNPQQLARGARSIEE